MSNPKTSKYKDPDRYIERLKNEIEALKDCLSDLERSIAVLGKELAQVKESAHGTFLFNWPDNVKQGVGSLSLTTTAKLFIGQEAWMKCRVIKIEKTIEANDSGATFELQEVFIKDAK